MAGICGHEKPQSNVTLSFVFAGQRLVWRTEQTLGVKKLPELGEDDGDRNGEDDEQSQPVTRDFQSALDTVSAI